MKCVLILALTILLGVAAAETGAKTEIELALPQQKGQLKWSVPKFEIVQSSVKANGQEIGVRGKSESGQISFLGFVFLFSEQAPLTSAKCRDGVLGPEKKMNPTLKISEEFEDARSNGIPVAWVSYTAKADDGSTAYKLRGFVATGDVCGDLEIYSKSPIKPDEGAVKAIRSTYQLDAQYEPNFNDVFVYAQVLYNQHQYKAAAPMFELALAKLPTAGDSNNKTVQRILTDQAGMSYGMSGDLKKARTLFESVIAADPEYPIYYYNLACADAEEKKLADAKIHLQEAFARKAYMIPGEPMPVPTADNSFQPYQSDKEFWTFLEHIH